MLKYLLPTLPVWSNLLIGDLTRHSHKYNNFMYDKKRFFIQNPPKTQGYMEAYNKIFKESALSRFRYRLDVLLEKMYASILSQQRKFVIQYKVAKPRKASQKATTLMKENWSRTPRETTKRMRQTSLESLFARKEKSNQVRSSGKNETIGKQVNRNNTPMTRKLLRLAQNPKSVRY
ncbi:hypothetical protein HOLleu_03734 [Holothuria leucospilota]|uniref:Uncharacterized protein n=1 Tax=Holothuria leucospilota TaxID=206669 RepID=A0A9Q1HLH6_HOLLE|nr:hypothetical protein HOLleu_03734 [Holothuria leucospilota]